MLFVLIGIVASLKCIPCEQNQENDCKRKCKWVTDDEYDKIMKEKENNSKETTNKIKPKTLMSYLCRIYWPYKPKDYCP